MYLKLIFNTKYQKMDLTRIIHQENTTIVDVRELYEFATGHAEGAIPIPLGTIPQRIEEFKKMDTPIVVYCRSGMRSAQAMGYLKSQGIKEVYNGGGIEEILYHQRQTV